ncbi:MAG: hypothetical protein EA396_04055 [Anaerolineaceae bacterium]|nr:MAG: hypothetical protein EA396_04055 [Anaerolineaceae bacterium]
MLVRAYRLTDKFGVAILKLGAGFSEIVLGRASSLTGAAGWFIKGLSRLIAGALAALLSLIWGLAVNIWQLLAYILRGGAKLLIGTLSTGAAVGASVGRVGKQAAKRNRQAASRVTTSAMARRSERQTARAEMTDGISKVAQDPLRVQNRVLSTLVVVFLAVLIGVIIWATSRQPEQTPAFTPAVLDFNPRDENQPTPASEALNEPLRQPTPLPTATEVPAVLQAGGTIAFTAREPDSAHSDLWIIPVGSRQPLRVTNAPEDDRDAAWSPNGDRLAYASRREDSNWDIYLLDMTSAALEPVRMTFNLAFEAGPSWSPDGQFIAYEAYQRDTHLDIFVMRADGQEPPQRLPGSSDTADFAPAWSPGDGRQIAFVSWRDGSKDIFIFDLDSGTTRNITNSPDRHEDFPAWSPDGRYLAYSAMQSGIETVFIHDMQNPDEPAQPFRQGREPVWSPDGTSVLFAVDTSDGTFLVVAPFIEGGVATELIRVPRGASDLSWTAQPAAPALVNSGGLPPADTEPLYIEQVSPPAGDPPYRLDTVVNITGQENAVLSERVNDSFNALRLRANQIIGWDFLGELTDTFWVLDRRPQAGEPERSWHKAGRAVAFTRNQGGFPANYEVVKEDRGLDTYWRVFVRVAEDAQNGQLGEPLREMPWDFSAATRGDLEAYRQGGRLRIDMPEGYYVDLTALAESYGWHRIPAGSDWRSNFNVRNYWALHKHEGLSWAQAMREIYSETQLAEALPGLVSIGGDN